MTNSNVPFSRDAYDDLADLFLTGPEAIHTSPAGSEAVETQPLRFPRSARGQDEFGDASPRPKTQGRLLAMMRVNLPVIAGPWLEQAASVLAAEVGPVALLRERGSHMMLDLIAGREGQRAVAACRSEPVATLDAAVRQLRDVMACWAVEVQTPAAPPETDWSQFDEIVLLTGADEAATVAAFAQVKALRAALETVPRLCLIVVGSEDDVARRAGGRIARACEESLGCEVELRAIVRRMQPVPMRHLGRFEREQGGAAVIARVLAEAATSPTADARNAPAVETVAAPRQAVPSSSARIALRPRARRSEAVEPRAQWRDEPPMPEIAHRDEPTAAAPSERKQPDEGSAKRQPTESRAGTAHPQPAERRVSATLVELIAELRPLDATCPRAPGVELAFDQQGRLHALVEDDGDGSLHHLIAAGDWAREHGGLLRKLNPWLGAANVESSAAPVLHLFTARPRERRILAEGSMRVHILVRDADGSVVAHLDLN